MNKENYAKVLAQIEVHPETWKQDSWHCGTQHCFAGHAQILSGRPADDKTARRDARIFLDLSRVEADYFFQAYRTLKDFRDGYNRAGYDRAGYDRDGYDSDGLDKHNKSKP